MSYPFDPIAELLEKHRLEASLRHNAVGPIADAVGARRDCFTSIRALLNGIETCIGVHLEFLNVMTVSLDGSR